MGTSRPTIYDVARVAGVSKSLVSLVLQGSDRVSESSRLAVQAAIRDLAYRPSRAAVDLAASRTRIVGVLIDDYANPWFVGLLRGLNHVLLPGGYRISVIDATSARTVEDPVNGLLSMRTDGIVIATDVPELLRGIGSPPRVIAGTRENVLPGVDAVGNDDKMGAQLATEHLIALGHSRIAHLSAAGGTGRARREGFEAAIARADARGLVTDYSGPATEYAGFDSAKRLMAEHPDVTAIFAANDVMAIGALGAARERSIDVPGDISIVGYDNTPLAQTRLINLTTVDDNSFGVGREAARILQSRMDGQAPAGVRTLLEPTLIVRGTTAAAH